MYLGLDIGGTKINSVLMSGNRIIKKRRVALKSKSNKEIMLAQIFDCIESLINSDVRRPKIKGIGIGYPGPMDFRKQKILSPPNVTALKNLFLAKLVQRHFRIKTIIDNDANCFGLAEAVMGAGKGAKILAGLTLGTGLGGAIVIDKKIFHGASGGVAEFGHIKIDRGGRKCTCGAKGCLEAYVSIRGIMKTAKGIGFWGRAPREIWELAKKGDEKAIKVYQITGEYLGIGLANIVNILNPDIIVIGGGIANAGKFIFDPAKKAMKKNVVSSLAKNTKIVKARLGQDAGAIGASLLFK